MALLRSWKPHKAAPYRHCVLVPVPWPRCDQQWTLSHSEQVPKFHSPATLWLLSCVFSSFTDSYTGSDGQRHYGIVTGKGLWPSPASGSVDLSAYKLRLGDFVHALLSLTVFAVLGLLDTNIVRCFYPGFESSEKVLMQVIPPSYWGSV
ncbi:Protein DMP [Sesbania bispinosa]|nr:Protein DMP [Sesbania bispinosa]